MNKPLSAKEFIKRKNDAFEKEKSKQKTIGLKDISRKGKHHFHIEARTFMPQTNLPDDKVFVVERLKRVSIEGKIIHRHAKIGDIEYRIGYYIVGKNGNKKDKWTWGQFCPLIPKNDLNKLLAKAKREKTLL